MEVLALKTKYPQGGERQLIYATTGRAINSAMPVSYTHLDVYKRQFHRFVRQKMQSFWIAPI